MTALRSGVVLCALAEAIRPGVLKHKVSASKMPFPQRENVNAFVDGALPRTRLPRSVARLFPRRLPARLLPARTGCQLPTAPVARPRRLLPAVPCHGRHATSRHVDIHHVVSCRVTSCHVASRHLMSRHATWCHGRLICVPWLPR